MKSSLNIICLETDAFYKLIDEVVEHVKSQHDVGANDPWIDDKEAMRLLNISSKTTLQNYRDQGKIKFTQPSRKVILYYRESILDFLDKHAKDTF